MSKTVYLSLGSNLGDREQNLINAVQMISCMEGFETVDCSPIFISEAVEMDEDAPTFFNMVVKGEFDFLPTELLDNLEEIERNLGRTGKGDCQPRPIDIDIILFGDEVMENERLSIPHRKMLERPFVLTPLLEIAPDIVHPVTGEKIITYCSDEESDQLVMYKEFARHHART
ncbi:MAG: 2-amino-4-hydroxy-6-hydroxymethyldihydropteridine diphosphokinase [Candidatus Zixiibacteriota bacterium]|nr:MAG: 2-amino-4-hydroxy-6-hydroxymethyldihydropteridine diphosphokinase [candidate division Zixibacteria bacterium]